jgi:bifunctional DNA-binding transcriptional regulator/antitoxin component of YhaV-PrlF toxin-antitoxin module
MSTSTATKEETMPTVKLGTRDEIRLPAEVKKNLKLRKGAKLEVLYLGEGVYIVPAGRIPKDQRYFYTKEWQQGERDVNESLARGEGLGPFADAEEAIKALRSAKV